MNAPIQNPEATASKKPRSKYQKRRAARRNGAPMKARPIPPWWALNGGLGAFEREIFATSMVYDVKRERFVKP